MPDNEEKEGLDPRNVDEFLGRARRRFQAAADDEKELRIKFVDDLKFASPDGEEQWPAQLKTQREQAGRPAMSFPRCHTFVQQVANQARQNKPQVKFAPRLEEEKDTAEVYEGLARYIQYASDAQIAYDTAIEYSAGGSFGYYRFLTEYCDDDSDDLNLTIVPVYDPLTVYGILVPAIFGRKPKYWFVIDEIPKEEYKLKYPDSQISSISWEEAQKKNEGWIGSEAVRIAEYWWVEEKRVEGKRRPTNKIHFCKTNGYEILPGDDGETSETVWPGTKCNIIPVLGSQMIREGKPNLFSVVRPQKGAQQLLNYTKSRIAETLATSPISPFMVAIGQIPSGKEGQWKNLNTSPTPYLEYSPVDVNGKDIGPPQRQTFEPPIQALSNFVMQEVDDMKATTGIFDASLGNSANEVSGQAILRRQQQTDITTMHFMDNLLRSFRMAGEVIEELIPKIYDTAREIQILGPDESSRTVTINKPHKDPRSGKNARYDMTSVKGSLVVTSGKAFDSKREETFDTMQQLVQSAPNMLPMFGDVLFDASDMAGADIVAERFRKMLPPNLQDNENPLPPQAQAVVAQYQQQNQLLQQELQKLQFEKQAKQVEHQGKLQQIQLQAQSDMALENRKLENQLAVAEIETKSQITSERMQFVDDLWKQFHGQAHEVAMQAAAAKQQQALAQQQAQNQSAQSAQDASQQSGLAAQQAAHTSAQSQQDAEQSMAAQAAQPQENE